MVAARRILREQALPATQRRLRLPTETIERLAADGLAQSLQVLGAIDPGHAGWALLLSGIRIARSADTLAPPSTGRRPDTSFSVGLVWGGLVIAVAGDQLIDGADDLEIDAEWVPGSDAEGARKLAGQFATSLLDPISSPGARAQFATDSLDELNKALAGLDHRPAGWMLCTFGVWIGSGVGGVAAPLAKRGALGFRRVTRPPRALTGCGLAGALLAETGTALLDAP
jgi:hypothetical protein